MSKINLKKMRFIPLFYEIKENYDLTYQQAGVYGYIFNHCMNLNDKGYVGYSDEKMAAELGLANSTFRREVKVLKDKNLIIIRNPQKRSKKAGDSRMIYINTDVYMQDVQLSTTDIELDNLKKENERLKKQLKHSIENNQKYEIHKNIYTMRIVRDLYKLGLFELKKEDELHSALAGAYEGLAIDYGHEIVMQHISYMTSQIQNNRPNNVIGYLVTSFNDFAQKRKHERKFDEAVEEFGYEQAFVKMMRGEL